MRFIVFVSLLSFTAANCQPSADASSTVTSMVTTAEFKSLMDTLSDYVLIDVRTPPEIAQGKIENALEMDVKDASFASSVDQLDPNKTILVYCRSGKRSTRAARIMEQKGFQKIYNLKGGYLDWKSKFSPE